MSLSENLKRLRNHRGLTQEEVSKYLKMNRATYAHYETGRREPDVATLKLLADFFNVTTDELLSEYSPDENGPDNSDIRNPYTNDKGPDEVDEFLLELKKEMEKQGLQFDETSPQELIETYKLLKEFKKKTKGN